jgi:hypothetical protein
MIFSDMTQKDWFQLFTFILIGVVIIYFTLERQGFSTKELISRGVKKTCGKPVDNLWIKKR